MADLAAAVASVGEAADVLAGVNFSAEPGLGEQLVELRSQLDRLEGGWLRGLGEFDARGEAKAAGAVSTSGWLRHRCGMSANAAARAVRIARGLRELSDTAAAVERGDISVAQAEVIAAVVTDLGAEAATEAEAILLRVAGSLDAAGLRKAAAHLRQLLDPEAGSRDAQRQHRRRGVSLSQTLEGMFRLDGWLDAEGGSVLAAALSAFMTPTGPDDSRTPGQRRADALVELARVALDSGQLPQTGGQRPHVGITIDWHTLAGQQRPDDRPAAGAAEMDWGGVVPPEIARRYACDGWATRITVDRYDTTHPAHPAKPTDTGDPANANEPGDGAGDADSSAGFAAQALAAALPRLLRDPPAEVLDVGRATRVVPLGVRRALAVRDGGCCFPGCDRPPG